MTNKARYERRPLTPSVFAMLWVGSLAMFAAVATTLCIPVTGWSPTTDWPVIHSGFEVLSTLWRNFWANAPLTDRVFGINDDIGWRIWSILLVGFIGGHCGFSCVYAATPLVDEREHLDGGELVTGKPAVKVAARAMKTKIGKGEVPILLTDGVPYPRLWRVLNLLVVGGIGSGKTRIILALIDQLLGELKGAHGGNAALLVYDTTGEILSGLPLGEDAFAALHPHRPGGWGWAMGRDLETIVDMEEAADQGIASSNEGMWGKGAAAIATGCMAVAKSQKGEQWGAPDYYAAALLPPSEMKEKFEAAYPPAALLIEYDDSGELSKTSVSTLLTFRACVLRYLRPLAEAWEGLPPEKLFSFREWVQHSGRQQPKTVVLQRSGRHPAMSAYWIGMAFDTIASNVGDGRLPVSQSRIRTLVLDELPTLGQLAKLPSLLDTGRNKGVATIAAVQDFHQLDVYEKAAKSLKARFRLKVFAAQTPGPELKEIAEKEIGMRRVTAQSYTNGCRG